MSDAGKAPEKTKQEPGKQDDAPFPEKKRRRFPGFSMKSGALNVRSQVASLIWVVAVICALFLAIGALLVALKANQANDLVMFVLDGARLLDGPFEDLFTFTGENAETKAALVNWGIAAVAYLVAGKVLDRLVRP